jgi:hypothetical protein
MDFGRHTCLGFGCQALEGNETVLEGILHEHRIQDRRWVRLEGKKRAERRCDSRLCNGCTLALLEHFAHPK